MFVEPPSHRPGMPDGVYPYPGHPAIATVDVRVDVHGKPIVLVLGSYAPFQRSPVGVDGAAGAG